MGKGLSVSSVVPVMRMAHIVAAANFLRGIGTPIDGAFERAGLPLLCESPDAYVPVQCVRSFFDDMAQREGGVLGWEVGGWAQEGYLHRSLIKHLEMAPSLEFALRDFFALVGVEYSHYQLGMSETEGGVRIWLRDNHATHTPGYHIGLSYVLWIIIGIIRHFIDSNWTPDEIGIESRQVPEVARQMLPETHFIGGQKLCYVRFSRALLSRPSDGEWMVDRDSRKSDGPAVFTHRLDFNKTLRLLLESYLQENGLTAHKVATLIDASPRTLRRRLANEGWTFSGLLDQVRYDAAKALLSDVDVKMVDIAYALGYTDPSHFTRSFRRLTGVCPTAFRRDRYQTGDVACI